MPETCNPLVSVIIPTFNHAAFLPRAIESCLLQSYQQIEVIIIDDGSEDNTAAVVRPFLRDSRVQYYYQDNAGRSAARNYGLKLAKGEFWQFLDADDALFYDKIARQVEILNRCPDSIAVYCATQYVRPDGVVVSASFPHAGGRITGQLLMGNFLPIHAVLIRRNDTRFDPTFSHLEDWKFWNYALFEQQIEMLPVLLCQVTIHAHLCESYIFKMKKGELRLLLQLLHSPAFRAYRLRIVASVFKRIVGLLKFTVGRLLRGCRRFIAKHLDSLSIRMC